MAYDLEEQEQLDEFKAWWNKHGKMVTNVVIVGLLAYAGWQGYQYWNQQKSVEASTLYQTLVTTDTSKAAEIKAQTEALTKNFGSTPYAGRAAVYAAKVSYQSKDLAAAKSHLEWAKTNAKESSVQAIASLQLASIAYENKDYDGAKKILGDIKEPGYLGLKDNMVGDVLLAQGNSAEAKKSFESALKTLDPQGRFYALTKQKLESLGS